MSDQTEDELERTIPQERMMVIERRFGYRYLSLFWVVLLLINMLILGLIIGRYWQPPPSEDDLNQIPLLEDKIKALELVNRELEQDLIDVRVTASIDKSATTMVQESLAELQHTIADQRKAISFYKGMMSPNELQKASQFVPCSGKRAMSIAFIPLSWWCSRLLFGTVWLKVKC